MDHIEEVAGKERILYLWIGFQRELIKLFGKTVLVEEGNLMTFFFQKTLIDIFKPEWRMNAKGKSISTDGDGRIL